MQIFKLDFKNPDPRLIKKMVSVIKTGGIAVVPTDTVYGICCDALNEKTVKKLLKLKKRRKDKGFNLGLYPFGRIFKYAKFNPLIPEILEKFPKQPLSFALPKKRFLPDFLNPGLATVTFHFFFSKWEKDIFKYIDTPIIGTSANISELPDTNSIDEVANYFRHTFGSRLGPDLILDGGKLKKRKASAIIELSENKIKVVREGDTSKKIIEKKLEKIKNKNNETYFRH
jgi:L-threonylcarbamoyladenylate synthase